MLHCNKKANHLMIVSDTFRFAFLHIPKCAGTTVRLAIEQFDQRYAAMTDGLEPHPDKAFTFRPPGEADFADFHHLTLGQLHKWFPDDLQRLRDYRSYAIIRDPHARLTSSLSQRLKQFHKVAVEDLSPDDFNENMATTLTDLERLFETDDDLPFDYVHFQPQARYVNLNGEHIIDRIYGSNQLDTLQADVAGWLAQFGEEVPAFYLSRANSSKEHRFRGLQTLVTQNERMTKVIKSLIPGALKPAMRGILYTDRRDASPASRTSETVAAFVEKHYAEDLALWKETQATTVQVLEASDAAIANAGIF